MDNPDLQFSASPTPAPDSGSGAEFSGKQESKSDTTPGDSRQGSEHEPGAHEPPLVLLVEDNPTNAIPAFDYLTAKGYRVIHAHDGYEALAQAAVLRPRIILMDIMMPRMDGLEATRRLRAHPDAQVAATPIIVVTARAMQEDREACLEAGADEYMAKPISLKALLGNIEALLRARRT